MHKFFSKCIKFFIIASVLIGLLMVALVFLVPTDKIKESVVKKVEKATGAEVTVGSASLTFFPPLGVRLKDVRVEGTGEALALASGSENNFGKYTLDMDHLDLRLSVIPLFKKSIEVDSINFAGQLIQVEQVSGLMIVEDYSLEVGKLTLPMVDNRDTGSSAGSGDRGEKRPPGEQLPDGLAFELKFSAAGLTFQNNLFQDISLAGAMAHKVLKLDGMNATRSAGTLTGEMIVDWAENPWGRLTFKLQASGVPSGALFSPWLEGVQQRLDCNLDGGVTGGCDLKDQGTILNTLDLVGSLHSGKGTLYARDILQDVSKYLGKRQDLKDIHFHALTHNFQMKKGRYLVQDLEIDGLDTDWTCNGWISLQGNLDLAIRVKLPPEFTPDLGNWSFLAESLRDADGRVPLAFKLRGQTSRPTVNMDFSSFGKAKQEAQQTAGQAVEDAAKKGLSEILDKWKTR